jgi:hypothetical protein
MYPRVTRRALGSLLALPVLAATESAAAPLPGGTRLVARRGPLYLVRGVVHGARLHAVSVPMDGSMRLAVGLAERGLGSDESFRRMVGRYAPAAAITGTFFGINNLLPTGDMVICGRACYQGFVGTALTVRRDGVVQLAPQPGPGGVWRGCDMVLRGGPRLLAGGRAAGSARSQGFTGIAEGARRARTAIGLGAGRMLLLAVTDGVPLSGLAGICRALGCTDAVAMDGGSSTALAFGGAPILSPGRRLTNLLMVYDDSAAYAAAEPLILASLPTTSVRGDAATFGALSGEAAAGRVTADAPPRIEIEIFQASAPLFE